MSRFLLSSMLLVTLAITMAIAQRDSGAVVNSTSASLLDSINRDLEEIKATISKTLKSPRFNTTSFSFSSTPDSDTDHASAHYLVDFDTDRPFVGCSQPNDGDSLWKYSIPLLNHTDGEQPLQMSQFRGKPLLLVNVATFCESTIEYPMYNQLKEKYGDNLNIIGFPSNQFANQEPTADPTEIYNAIKYVRPGNGFVPMFPLTQRIDVNGAEQHPIFSFLKRCCPSTRTRFSVREERLHWKPKNSRDIRWNFEKFLIHPDTGFPIKRYDQKFLPDRIIPDIDRLMEEMKLNRRRR